MTCKYCCSVLVIVLAFSTFFILSPPLAAEKLTVSISIPDYRLVPAGDGHRIEIEGYGTLAAPGKPVLPLKNFLIALPPGATVRSVEVTGTGALEVPGIFRIEPAPALETLTASDHLDGLRQRMQDEWHSSYEAVYSSDEAYPEKIGVLTGSGTLRKYSYASVSVYPFRYYPLSGNLVFYSGAMITIDYALPAPGGPEAQRVQELMQDTAADSRAERLFCNSDKMRDWYQPASRTAVAAQESYNYLVITTSSLAPSIAASDFPAWKDSLGFDVGTVLVTDPEITSQPGFDLAQKIRNFLRAYYVAWNIEYVLFVGNVSDVPMRYCFPDPGNHSSNIGTPNAYSGEVPTDFYYADLSSTDADSWDSDGDGYYGEWGEDSPDLLAEVYVGRIPTSNATRITYTLDKLVRFERDDGSWKRKALHAGAFAWFENEDYSGKELKDLATYLSLIETDFMSGWTIGHLSERSGIVTSIYPWSPLGSSTFADGWRFGSYGVVNWGGHGWSDGVYGKCWTWDDGDGVAETYVSGELYTYQFIGTTYLMEDDYPSIVFALSCLVGYPESNSYGNLGVDLLTKPSFGTAAGIVSGTRVVWVSQGGGELHCYEFNHYLIDPPYGSGKVGEALYEAQYHMHYDHSWDHFAEYWDIYTFNLYGDPAMQWAGAETVTGSDNPPPSPSAFHLMQNYPNPFNPVTTIAYELPARSFVSLTIYDSSGRLIKRLVNATRTAGVHSETWDGRDGFGNDAASGIYFYYLKAGRLTESRKMVLLR